MPTVTPAGQTLLFASPSPAAPAVPLLTDAADPAALDMDIDVGPVPWPADLNSLGHITVGGLFIQWYLAELYRCDYDIMTNSVKKHYNMCKKTVQYCKLFLPGGVVINNRPYGTVDFENWSSRLHQLAADLETKMKHFLEERPVNVKERNRSITMFVSPTYKRLATVEKRQKAINSTLQTLVLPLQTPPVVDLAWSC